MPPRQEERLDLDLRYGYIRQAQTRQPRLPGNLRQLGAVGAAVPPPPPGSRQTVVKVWVARPSTTGAHLRYLQQGKGREGQDATLFGPQGLDVTRFRREAGQDPHQFRLVIAPTQATPRLLQPLVQDLLRQAERDVRRPLDWVAAIHQDTAHVHAHVLLRGRDREGQPLYIAKPYLTQGLRDRVRTLATWYLGREPATERTQERLRAIERDLAKDRRLDGWER